MAVFNAVMLGSTFGVGVALASVEIGLWAAGLTVVMPGLYRMRLEFWQDFPLAAMVMLGFLGLTLWRATGETRAWQPRSLAQELGGAIAFGLILGLALLTKQTALFFLAVPMAWLGIGAILRRHWGRLGQLVGVIALSALVWWPWYSSNWFLMLTAGKRATVDSAAIEGDPSLASLDAWTFYARVLPHSVTWPLVVVPGIGLVGYGIWRWRQGRSLKLDANVAWLLVFLVGGYVLSTLNVNKDSRYILPLLPGVAVGMAMALSRWGQKLWGRQVCGALAGLSVGLAVVHTFPVVPVAAVEALSGWGILIQPDRQAWPHLEVIDTAIAAEPYLRSTIGVLPSTPDVNQHNINYFGGLRNFQVYGRQVGVRDRDVEQDARSMHWFLTKTGDQGSIPESQPAIVKLVREGDSFEQRGAWSLPGGQGDLQLYRRREPVTEVEPLGNETRLAGDRLRLETVIVPARVPPGQPVPVTYRWVGRGDVLQNGILLLRWELAEDTQSVTPSDRAGSKFWLHDRALAGGHLLAGREPERAFRVTERMAMLPPEDAIAGVYRLSARYLDRETGDSFPLDVSADIAVEIADDAASQPAPELDLPSQLRQWVPQFRQGDLDPVFAQVGRINQYDPIQDYLEQVAIALNYRLDTESELAESPPTRDTYVNWIYAVALARAQQQNVPATIAALERAVALDGENPYSHALLAFVQLYRWNPRAAQPAIDRALAIAPDDETIQILNGAAALMKGNAIAAWRILEPLL
ncbi:MAG: phospholipid carrier-dependent glycosyltransferase [Cyanobacteria bacterium J06639_1]